MAVQRTKVDHTQTGALVEEVGGNEKMGVGRHSSTLVDGSWAAAGALKVD